MSECYAGDFQVGQTFGSGRRCVDRERAKVFAAEFDPQPFNLDEPAPRNSVFGGLAVSGWHSAAVTMRLLDESQHKPAVQPSKSRPARGLIKVRTTNWKQVCKAVQDLVANLIVSR